MTLPAHLPRFKLKDIQDKPLISSLKLEKRTGISYSVQKDTLSVPDFENCPTKLIHTDSPRSKDFFRSGGHVPDMSQELVLHNQLIRSSQVGLPKRDENPSGKACIF